MTADIDEGASIGAYRFVGKIESGEWQLNVVEFCELRRRVGGRCGRNMKAVVKAEKIVGRASRIYSSLESDVAIPISSGIRFWTAGFCFVSADHFRAALQSAPQRTSTSI